jgi:hypothetical protein
MESIERRIEKLEKAPEVKPKRKTWVLLPGQPIPDGVGDTDIIIRVGNENAKQLVERVIAGEGTE